MSVDDPRLVHESLVALLEATDASGLLAELDETGWFEMYDADAPVAVGALFEAQGEVLPSSPMLGVVLGHALSRPDAVRTSALLPMPGMGDTPPAIVRGDGVVHVDGCLLGVFQGDSVIVAASTPDGAVTILEMGIAALAPRPIDGLDPTLRLSRFAGAVEADGIRTLVADGADAWNDAVALARLAVSHELTALARAAVTLAVEHAKERVQFGQPIGAFQAVQHRLADATVAAEVARFGLQEAWHHRAHDTAALAKVLAGRGAREAAKQAQQVLGGMGFSWEHPFHWRLRRMLFLDLILGSCTQVEREIGVELLRRDGLPELRAL